MRSLFLALVASLALALPAAAQDAAPPVSAATFQTGLAAVIAQNAAAKTIHSSC